MIYANFACVYDRLMQDVPYTQWINYLDRLFKKHDIGVREILDIGCGTGNVTLPLAELGYQLTGLDMSAEMLAVAEQKARDKGLQVKWIKQDMKEMDLGGLNYELVISMTDSLNYLNTIEDLEQVFNRVRGLLKPGGWLIFDLNTHYKISEVFGNNTFTLVEDDITYIWDNDYDDVSQTCEMDLTFFVREA
ncbi:MAG TPA: class I SAM-dependent methyltransferase, partial [Desulfobacteria bacterium]|nr:class I SAM-dependent methyltransferase [Desulfobacteria bacterium]